MTCKDCIYSPICKVYADFGVTDVPYNENDTCEIFKSNSNLVEVVRCKDCEFYKPYYDPLEGFYGQCLVRECDIGETDYCSYGKRKEGAEND